MNITNLAARLCAMFIALAAANVAALAQQPTAPPQQQAATPAQAQSAPATQQTPPAQPAIETWSDKFETGKLDETKWELYSMEGGGKVEVKDKALRMRGGGSSRSGVRTKRAFNGSRFYVEGGVAGVAGQLPQPGAASFQPGFAIMAVIFGGSAANRIEWLIRSDGLLEAWVVFDGKGERIDNRKLATKEKSPRLGIGRRDDKFYFMINGQVGLEHTVNGYSQDFKVMLYGYGSSEVKWDSAIVQTPKQ